MYVCMYVCMYAFLSVVPKRAKTNKASVDF